MLYLQNFKAKKYHFGRIKSLHVNHNPLSYKIEWRRPENFSVYKNK